MIFFIMFEFFWAFLVIYFDIFNYSKFIFLFNYIYLFSKLSKNFLCEDSFIISEHKTGLERMIIQIKLIFTLTFQ